MTSWRPSLRMAWRDARRSRARSILVLVMIALPVLGVTAADVVLQTSDVSGAEALDRRLGGAEARITVQRGVGEVFQGADPDDASGSTGAGGRGRPPGPDEIRGVLGDDVRLLQWGEDAREVSTDKGILDVEVAALDLRDPLAEGIFRVESGTLPGADDEVVVNTDLAGRGFAIGDPIEVAGAGTFTVVGIGESTSYRDYPRLVGPSPELAGADGTRTWLADSGPVEWSEVRELNTAGAFVLSRSVMLDPPPDSALPAEIQEWGTGQVDDATLAVAALGVVMALIEVVLLAGPAFAVGARRQARTLALIAASGGTPRQARRVVLASALVLGGLGALLGVLLGLGAAAVALPVLQRFSGSWFGPFDVPWLHLLGIAAFGLLSAFLAAVVPAWLASRQDVVAVLAGRRGDRPAGARSPIAGVLLLGVGVAMSVYGATAANGVYLIAAGAIPTVLGMILLVALALTGLAGVSRHLPLTMRYAVRDAARHRTRTVPAVAAVAATVAGVVALGVANASDAAQNEAMYTPTLPMGQASITAWNVRADSWTQLRTAVDRELPGAGVAEVEGLPEDLGNGRYRMLGFHAGGEPVLLDGWGSSLGSAVLVSDEASDLVLPGLSTEQRARADEVLAAGGAVVYASKDPGVDEVKVRVTDHRENGRGERAGSAVLPAVFVEPPYWMAPGQAVLSTRAAQRLGTQPATVSLAVLDGVTTEQERDLEEALGGVSAEAGIYVERGYQADDETLILLLVLGGLGGLLMLGGTLTATFLALSDARPDLATLAAVGASPRTRRGVAASYAVVVGLVGAVLGAAVGFVPGIAASYPLTGSQWTPDNDAVADHYLDVPWLLVAALVLVLPLLTAAIVGLTARSRLPLVARVD